jgi:carboxyl-terminal processing protease
VFEGVWSAINDNYYDPHFNGVDWRSARERFRPLAEAAASDREFYGLFEVMLSELREGHTTFIPPPPADGPTQKGSVSLGIELASAEGTIVVASVRPGSEAEGAGVLPGMALLKVNGKSVEEHFSFMRSVFATPSSERNMERRMLMALLYGGFLANPRKLLFADFSGAEFEAELSPRAFERPPNLSARRLASGVAYIKFGSWQSPVEEEFEKELTGMLDAPGLVIDLRGNGGGNTSVLLDIAGNFFGAETLYGGFRGRGGALEKHFTRRKERVCAGEVVVLVDEGSASASESFTIFMQESGRAKVAGRQSAGSTLNLAGGERHFKGGGKLLFSTSAYVSPGGRNPEGVGVIPDVHTPLKIADLRQGRDAALEAAETLLARP